MIPAILKNLHVSIRLLESITDQNYQDVSVKPYFASIGSHIRHCLDVFECILGGLERNDIDLSARDRDPEVESNRQIALERIRLLEERLSALSDRDFCEIVKVQDDLGMGLEAHDYTLGSVLIQAHSHWLHHQASIGYILSSLDIELPDPAFGMNPTTPVGHLTGPHLG